MKMVHLEIGVRIYQITPSLVFCHGEISKSNFKSYLEQLPLIDLVYAALPKPENFLF